MIVVACIVVAVRRSKSDKTDVPLHEDDEAVPYDPTSNGIYAASPFAVEEQDTGNYGPAPTLMSGNYDLAPMMSSDGNDSKGVAPSERKRSGKRKKNVAMAPSAGEYASLRDCDMAAETQYDLTILRGTQFDTARGEYEDIDTAL